MQIVLPTASRLPSLSCRGGGAYDVGLNLSPSSSGGAIPAALTAPLASTLGIHQWEDWSGSAFALNGFKCVVATALFGVTLLVAARGGTGCAPLSSMAPADVRMLGLSAFVGVIVGDLLWLRALQLLGAHDTIVMSALHPVIAWVAGTVVLKQRSTGRTVLGVALVGLGVIVSQLFGDDGGERLESAQDTMPGAARLLGYSLNLLNIILDVTGSVLTRRFGSAYSTFEICFVRFGFASLGILAIGAFSQSFALLRGLQRPAWTQLPDQSARTWMSMGLGVILVTYLSPALGNYALFGLPLAVWTALGSLGPVYSIPIKWIRDGSKRISTRSIAGAALAVGGSAILGMELRS